MMHRGKTLGRIILLTGILAALPVAAQQPQRDGDTVRRNRIAVLPFMNTTGQEEIDRLANEMTRTITLILQLGGQYDVVPVDPFDPYAMSGPARLDETARNLRLQGIVIGRISSGDQGRIELESAVFGAGEGWLSGGISRVASGAFDIVEAADELVIATGSALAGFPVELGAIILRPSRDDVPFRVFVDGVSVGDGVLAIPQIPAGRRVIDIAIPRPSGDQFIHSADRLVRPGEALEIHFEIPSVTTGMHLQFFWRLELVSRLAGDPAAVVQARRLLAENRQIMDEDPEALPPELRERQEEMELLWKVEAAFLNPAVTAGDTPRQAAGHSEEVARRIRRNGIAAFHTADLHRMADLATGNWDSADERLQEMMEIDRVFNLGLAGFVRQEQQQWERARSDASGLREERSGAAPVVGMIAGAALVGGGGYLLAVDTGLESPVKELAQWGAVGSGVAAAVVSGLLWRRNRRADTTYLRRWADEEYGHRMAVATQLQEIRAGARSGDHVLVLGPPDAMISLNGRPVVLPALLPVEAGTTVTVNRPLVVPSEAQRPMTTGVTVVVVE